MQRCSVVGGGDIAVSILHNIHIQPRADGNDDSVLVFVCWIVVVFGISIDEITSYCESELVSCTGRVVDAWCYERYRLLSL
jgi:hypothetical protein